MVLLEIGLICLSLVSCVGICAGAYYLAEQRKAEIQQAGIDRRAAAKVTTHEPSSGTWEGLAAQALGNPELVKLVSPYIPGIMEKLNIQRKV